ncbi:unnamed protein product, partial [marine sediment metagenome]
PLTVSLTTAPAYGTATLSADGSFSYAPSSDFFGSDSFTYSLDDGQGGTDAATVAVTVVPVNDAPTIAVDLASQTVQYSDTIAAVTVTAADIDSVLTPSSLTSSAVPAALMVSSGNCGPAELGPAGVTGAGTTCAWTITGNIDVGEGSYIPALSVSDGQLDADTATTLIVDVEDADARTSDDNLLSIGVDSPGSDSSLAFTLLATVSELQPDQAANAAAPGEVGRADVTIRLVPVGPGSTVSAQSCTRTLSGAGY